MPARGGWGVPPCATELGSRSAGMRLQLLVPLKKNPHFRGCTVPVGRAEPTLHQKRGLQENLAGARGHS